jgi:hypothetical protein
MAVTHKNQKLECLLETSAYNQLSSVETKCTNIARRSRALVHWPHDRRNGNSAQHAERSRTQKPAERELKTGEERGETKTNKIHKIRGLATYKIARSKKPCPLPAPLGQAAAYALQLKKKMRDVLHRIPPTRSQIAIAIATQIADLLPIPNPLCNRPT